MKHFCSISLWLTIIALLISFGANAAPKQNIPVTLSQPNGDKIYCFVSGDEFYHRYHDANGYTIVINDKGYYVYAAETKGTIAPSQYIVGQVDISTVKEIRPNICISKEEYQAKRNAMYRAKPEGYKSLNFKNLERNGKGKALSTMNNLVIFIKFADSNINAESISFYDGLYNSTPDSSVSDYYMKASYNQFDIQTTFYPTPNGIRVAWYTDSHNRSYYQEYNAITNPDGYDPDAGYYSSDGRTLREHTLLKNAIESITVPSDINIDINNDGYVDAVSFIIEGLNEGWSELLWPHQWALFSQSASINGKTVYDYTFLLQRHYNEPLKLGTVCHELFHQLGAPDLYHYSSDPTIEAVGPWDIMCNTTDYPQSMGAYMKYKYGGWIDQLNTITTSGMYSINPLTSSDSQNVYKIPSPNSSDEFFVVEYRKREFYDANLPSEGILVYRINTLYNGNADGPPDEVYIYRPNGTISATGNLNAAPYNSESLHTSINNTTNPKCFLSSGSNGGLNISQVSSISDVMTFNVAINSSIPIILQNDNGMQSSFGSGSTYNITAATRFDALDLSEHVGKSITKVMIAIKSDNGEDVVNNETIKIWSGGNSNGPSTQIRNESIANSITYDSWYTHTLATPVIIKANTEYWIGYSASATSSSPFCIDGGPLVADKGLWSFSDGLWQISPDIDANWCIRAEVELLGHEIQATAGSNGEILPSGNVIVGNGQNQQFAITANQGYEIDNVLVDNVNVTSNIENGLYTFTNVTSNHSIATTFKTSSATQYSITSTSSENGTITPEGEIWVNEGSNQSLSFAPNDGYMISSVLVDGVEEISNLTNNIFTLSNIAQNHTIEVSFSPIMHTITVTTGANGTISPSGEVLVNDGGYQVFNIIADNQYKLNSLTIDDRSIIDSIANIATDMSDITYTLQNVKGSHTISAEFTQITAIDNAQSTSLRIFPNPTKTYFTVDYNGQPSQLKIFGITGNLLREVTIQGTTKIDISGLRPGVYIIKLGEKATRLIKL